MGESSIPIAQNPSPGGLRNRVWLALANHPYRFVAASFGLAFILLLLILLRGLLLAQDREIQSLRQIQVVRAESIHALVHLESERILSLRNYAEHLFQNQKALPAPRNAEGIQPGTQPGAQVWSLPAHDAAPMYRVAPDLLTGLDGFSHRKSDLPSDIAVAQAMSHLLSAAPQTADIRRRVRYVSSNGLLLSYPALPEQAALATLRRDAAAPYFQDSLPSRNPERRIRYRIAPATGEPGDISLFLSVPVYFDNDFRAMVILEIPRHTLDSQLRNAPFPDDASYLIDRTGRLIGASADNVHRGEALQDALAGHWTRETMVSIFATEAGTLSDGNGYHLIFRQIGYGELALVDEVSSRDLMMSSMARLSGVIGAGAAALIVLLWATLAVVRNLFQHYRERGEALRTLAETDALTGLANRRSFSERFAAECAHRTADSPPMSVIMLDIDYFKKINDHWGHASGDVVLRAVSDALRNNIRKNDLAARLGGEEFAILLPGAGADHTAAVAEQLRLVISALRCEPAADAQSRETIRFTASFGVAELAPDGPAKLDALLMLADKRLYDAKSGGRNRVVSG